MIEKVKENLKKIRVFFKSILMPIEDSFCAWQCLMNDELDPSIFWDDMSFFNCFNEDFFEWYDFDVNPYFED